MRRTLVKYNNIVKEKQRKVVDELSKFMNEKQKQIPMKKRLNKLSKEFELLNETKEKYRLPLKIFYSISYFQNA